MKFLVDVLGGKTKLSEEAMSLLASAVSFKEIKAKTSLQEEGKVARNIYFVEKGVARTYYYKDGKDITYWIAAENDFVGSIASFLSRKPSLKYVETLEDCILWEFNYDRLEKAYSSSQELEKLGRLFVQHAVINMEQRMDDLHFMSAKERYALLLKKHPEITLRVPLGIIASYLGITQETLSRIRNQTF